MAQSDDKRPHIDAVSGQAAWNAAQVLALRLVKEGFLPKKLLQEDLANFAKELHTRPGIDPAQRGAAILLKSLETLLNTADRSDAH